MIDVVISADVDRATAGITKVSKSLSDLKNSSNSANTVLINTGRVFQDLPFGIIGIANNINPLVESFSRLGAEAKTAGITIGSSLLKSLTGAGGLSFAFSLVTAGAQFAVLGLSAFTRGLTGSKSAIDEDAEALKKFDDILSNAKDALDAFNEALQFQKQLGGLNVKLGAITNLENLRQQTFDLRDQYQLLIKQGQQITQSQIDLQNNKDISADKRIEEENKLLQAQLDNDKAILKNTQDQRIQIKEIDLQKLEDQKDINKKLEQENERALKELQAQQQRWANLMAELSGRVRTAITQGQPNFSAFSPLGFNVKDLSTVSQQIADITAQVDFLTKAEQRIPGITTDEEIERLQKQIELLKQLQAAFPQVGGGTGERDNKKSKIGLTEEDKDLLQKAKDLASLITPAINQMVEAIARGENAFKAFGKAVISIMAQVAEKIIATAILAGILSALTGGAGGGGFGGAKGFGAIFSKLLGGHFATGGVVPGGYPNDSYPAMLSSNETVLTPQQLNGLLSGRGGGSESIDVNIFGDGVLLATQRAKKRQTRSFGA